MNPNHVNPIRMLRYVTHHSAIWHALAEEKPSVAQMLWLYVIPLSAVPPIMLYLVVNMHPKLFMDILPGDRLLAVGIILFLAQVCGIWVMALIAKNLAEMVDIKPSFRDAFLVTAVAVSPFWLVSLFYLVPNFTVNIIMHGIAGLASIALVWQGINSIFGLKRRGAAAMLTTAIGCTAALGFAVVLIGTLMSWNIVQTFQFSLK